MPNTHEDQILSKLDKEAKAFKDKRKRTPDKVKTRPGTYQKVRDLSVAELEDIIRKIVMERRI